MPACRTILALLLVMLLPARSATAQERASAGRQLDEPATAPVVTLPAWRGGQDRVGTRFPDDVFTRWLAAPAAASGGTPHETHGDTSQDAPSTTPGAGSHDPPADATENAPTKNAPSSPTPRLTLYRWWTDACPFCESSLPAMEALRLKYENEGLRVVGAYHPKPPRHVDDAFVRAAAARLGFAGEIAVDEQWSMLKEAYLKSGRRRATSISMLVDADGVIRFVHPGPELFPSTNPSNGRQNSDFELLEHAVRQLLALDDARPGPPGAPNAPSAGNTDAR